MMVSASGGGLLLKTSHRCHPLFRHVAAVNDAVHSVLLACLLAASVIWIASALASLSRAFPAALRVSSQSLLYSQLYSLIPYQLL